MSEVPSQPWQTVLLGIGVVVVGYLVRYRGWTTLLGSVAPFDTEEPATPIVTYAGNALLVTGVFVVVAGLLQPVGVLAAIPAWVQGLALLATVVLVTPRLEALLPSPIAPARPP